MQFIRRIAANSHAERAETSAARYSCMQHVEILSTRRPSHWLVERSAYPAFLILDVCFLIAMEYVLKSGISPR